MEETIHINMEQDAVYIPTGSHIYDVIHIECANNITQISTIQAIIGCVSSLHERTKIHVTCNMIPDVTQLLPTVQALTIRLDTPEDFERFLHMDNRLNVQDTLDKQLELIVKQNVQLNNCRPSDLPLIWSVIRK